MIDFTLAEEQRALQRAVGAFSDAHLVPHANRMDAERALDPQVLLEAAKLGLYGLNVPAEHGGLGLDTVSMGLAAAEMGRGCGSTALSLLAHNVLCVEHIRRRGTPAQQGRYLPRLASGAWVGAWGLTEPGGGSDVAAMRTTAQPRGEEWVLNGEKCFITNGSKADVVVVTARTPEGFGAFVVRKGQEGFAAQRSHDLACMRASDTASLHFDDCVVGAEDLLGDPAQALKDSFACLDLERVIAGAMLTSMAREMLRRSVAYSRERRAFGRPIFKFQAVYRKLARLDAAVEAAENLWLKAAWRRDRGEPFTREAAIAKLTAAELAIHAAHEAIQVHGGLGLEAGSGLDRVLRDSLLGTIGGGTTEMQELVIARHLGLEVEPGG
jgi:alkylation response protein AidB-like acyl-CoA dehydrogenase